LDTSNKITGAAAPSKLHQKSQKVPTKPSSKTDGKNKVKSSPLKPVAKPSPRTPKSKTHTKDELIKSKTDSTKAKESPKAEKSDDLVVKDSSALLLSPEDSKSDSKEEKLDPRSADSVAKAASAVSSTSAAEKATPVRFFMMICIKYRLYFHIYIHHCVILDNR